MIVTKLDSGPLSSACWIKVKISLWSVKVLLCDRVASQKTYYRLKSLEKRFYSFRTTYTILLTTTSPSSKKRRRGTKIIRCLFSTSADRNCSHYRINMNILKCWSVPKVGYGSSTNSRNSFYGEMEASTGICTDIVILSFHTHDRVWSPS